MGNDLAGGPWSFSFLTLILPATLQSAWDTKQIIRFYAGEYGPRFENIIIFERRSMCVGEFLGKLHQSRKVTASTRLIALFP